MAIAYRSESHLPANSTTSPTITEPAGATAGDVMLSLFVVDSPGGTPTPPTGWTTINSGSSTNGHFLYVFQYIVRGATAPALTMTYTGNNAREWFIVCYSGVNNTTPIDSNGTEAKVGGNASAPDPPATVAVNSAAMAFAAGIGWNGAPAAGWGAMSGYTKREGAPSTEGTLGFNFLGGFEKQLAAAGSENPGAFVGTPLVTDDTWAQTITLAPAGGSTTAVRARRTSIVPMVRAANY